MKTNVVLPSGYFNRIREYLFDGSENEFACFLFSGISRAKNRLNLLGRNLVLPDKEQDYDTNTPVSCKPNLYFIDTVLFDAPRENDLIKHNLSIVDFHSHPFSKGSHTGFSGTDDIWQKEAVDYFFNVRKYKGYYCFIVLGENSFSGRVWYMDRRTREFRYWNLDDITILDFPYKKWTASASKKRNSLSKIQSEMLNRQILAFGSEGQKVMSEATAGIVGVGGIGSIAAEGLVRLGVNNFILVDHDTAEISNLNRFVGMSYADALSGIPKVNISAREILSINPSAKVKAVKKEVFDPEAYEKLKNADFIILGTDNLLSRAFVNEFCLQYCIPFFSAGTIINADQDGMVQDIFSEFYSIIPGRNFCCLNCTGAVDFHEVSYLLSSEEVREEGKNRGYVNIPDFHQPAVRPLNGVITEMVLSEIHNWFCGFKEELSEGLSYDQKRNQVRQKRFLHGRIDENVDGIIIEAVSEEKEIQIKINGEGPYSVKEEKDAEDIKNQHNLNNVQEAAILSFFEKNLENYEKKARCPYCGNQGIIGRGNNEPLTDYRAKD